MEKYNTEADILSMITSFTLFVYLASNIQEWAIRGFTKAPCSNLIMFKNRSHLSNAFAIFIEYGFIKIILLDFDNNMGNNRVKKDCCCITVFYKNGWMSGQFLTVHPTTKFAQKSLPHLIKKISFEITFNVIWYWFTILNWSNDNITNI